MSSEYVEYLFYKIQDFNAQIRGLNMEYINSLSDFEIATINSPTSDQIIFLRSILARTNVFAPKWIYKIKEVINNANLFIEIQQQATARVIISFESQKNIMDDLLAKYKKSSNSIDRQELFQKYLDAEDFKFES